MITRQQKVDFVKEAKCFSRISMWQEVRWFFDYQEAKFMTSWDLVFVEDKFSYASMISSPDEKDPKFSTLFNSGEIKPIHGRGTTDRHTSPRPTLPLIAHDASPLSSTSLSSGPAHTLTVLDNA